MQSVSRHRYAVLPYQTECLYNQSPAAEETANDKAAQNSLDLCNTAMLRIRRELTNKKTCACSKKNLDLSASALLIRCGSGTHGKQNEHDVLHNPTAPHSRSSQCRTPRMPPLTLRILRIPPAAEALIKIKAPIFRPMAAVSRLQVTKPAAHYINEGSNTSTQYTRCNQDQPYLARIRQSFHICHDTRCAGCQVA